MFPIMGLIVATCAFSILAWAALSGAGTAVIETALIMLGAGLGFVMPNLTVAIQNSVERAHLGAATSVSAFLRSLGGALGVAVAGAVVALRLHSLLSASWRVPGASGATPLQMGFQDLNQLPPAQHALLIYAYRHAIATTFFTGAGIAATAFCIVLFLPERPLRSSRAGDMAASEEAAERVAY
jgi:MFS family permease